MIGLLAAATIDSADALSITLVISLIGAVIMASKLYHELEKRITLLEREPDASGVYEGPQG